MPGTVDMNREVTPDEIKALTTIEVMERLAGRALRVLLEDPEPSKEALEKVQDLLCSISAEGAIRTCTAVKSLALSDQIAASARETARDIIAKVEAR